MGRKSSFNEQLSAKINELYRLGKTDAQVAKIIGISRRTLNYWKTEHPQFLHTIKESKGFADDLVEASLFRRAIGYSHPDEQIFCAFGKVTRVKTVKHYPPETTAAIYWLNNRRPDEWSNKSYVQQVPPSPTGEVKVKTFEEFCATAGYPTPFQKQVEMMTFGMTYGDPRLLLGSRGYGKTDYITILGVAYQIYLDPKLSFLIITKSRERNTALIGEIESACVKNGMVFEIANASTLKVQGQHGKDSSVSAVTIKTKSLRGRHPYQIIMDDPVTEDDVSEATRKHVKRIWNEVNKLTKNVLVIGQPAHKFDLYAELRPALNKMEVPHGSIPELDADLEAQRLAGVDEASISASYHLRVLSEGTSPFENISFIDQFPEPGTSVAFIDPSDGGNDTALTIFKQYGQGMAVIGFTWKKAWHHCLEDMGALFRTHKVGRVAFETNKHGMQPLDVLRQAFSALGLDIGVVGRNSITNKHSRIMAAGTFAKFIHLSKGSHKNYIDQVVQYEYGSKVDDAPDSLATGLEWIGLIKGK